MSNSCFSHQAEKSSRGAPQQAQGFAGSKRAWLDTGLNVKFAESCEFSQHPFWFPIRTV
jgi:hypothetical protein